MAFTVRDFHDLIRLLEEHPEWQTELRRLLLTEDLLDLPALVHELLQAHQRSDERLARLETSVAELTETTRQLVETSKRHEERLARLEASVAELVEVTRRHEERLARLEASVAELTETTRQLVETSKRHEERLARLEASVAELTETTRQLVAITRRHEEQLAGLTTKVDRLDERVSVLEKKMERVEGISFERHYRDHAAAFFGRLIRRIRVLSSQAVDKLLEEPLERGKITWDERDDVLKSDVILRGRRPEDGTEVYLVAEVSVGVGHDDVKRAVRRAKILRRALECPVIAAVAGERIASKEVAEHARSVGVWQVLDGRILKPDKPLEET